MLVNEHNSCRDFIYKTVFFQIYAHVLLSREARYFFFPRDTLILRHTHLAVGNHPEIEKKKKDVCNCTALSGDRTRNVSI